MKWNVRRLKMAIGICRESRLYAFLTRREQKEAVIDLYMVLGEVWQG